MSTVSTLNRPLRSKNFFSDPPHLDTLPNTRINSQGQEQYFRIGFLNFFIANNDKSIEFWDERKKSLFSLIFLDKPTILGFCEVNLRQFNDTKIGLEGEYALHGYTATSKEELINQTNLSNPIQEIIGIIYKKNRIKIISSKCIKLPNGKNHSRIISKYHLYDSVIKMYFYLLVTHFDHLSENARSKEGESEINMLKKFEGKQKVWFSVGDKNWFPDENGEKLYQKYLESDCIDFRDAAQEHYGPQGTFAGYPQDMNASPIKNEQNRHFIEPKTIDVCFVNKRFKYDVAYSYAYLGEYQDGKIHRNSQIKNLEERNFISDHYYIGANFVIKKKNKISKAQGLFFFILLVVITGIFATHNISNSSEIC